MQTVHPATIIRAMRSLALVLLASPFALSPLTAQDAAHPVGKPTPATINEQLMIVEESVVTEQWAHTLKLVNAPQDVTLLNPGQCIRVGIVSTGDNRDAFLEKTRLSFRVNFAGQSQDHPLAALAQTKQIKPEGGDFVTAALAAGGIKNPLLTMASLGVSAEHWCVPADAQDGTATIEAEVESPSGTKTLKPATVRVESFETGSKRLFKDGRELNDFLMSYYRQPNPARLFPAVQSYSADTAARSRTGVFESTAVFLDSALKANPIAEKDFATRISTQTGFTRAFGLLALLNAGYDVNPVLKTMSDKDREMFAHHPTLPDPYDLVPDDQCATRLDMLWGVYMSTGDFAPVQKIATALAWHSDWDSFDKMRKSGTQIKELTPSIWRAVTYGAAGWALGSFQRNDPLVADYIEFMLASPDTPPAIKSELIGLSSNPAFKQTSGK